MNIIHNYTLYCECLHIPLSIFSTFLPKTVVKNIYIKMHIQYMILTI